MTPAGGQKANLGEALKLSIYVHGRPVGVSVTTLSLNASNAQLQHMEHVPIYQTVTFFRAEISPIEVERIAIAGVRPEAFLTSGI